MMNLRTFFLSALKPFTSLLIHSYIFIIFSLLTTLTLSNYVDPKFEACEPKACGNGQNISFPFYIKGKQEPFCGYPSFELTCDNSGFPILNLINTAYIVQEIFYNNHTLRVSNPVFSEITSSDQCIAPTQNLTVGKYRFNVASNNRDMLLFYGCDLTSLPEQLKENKIGCSQENKTSSVVAFDRGDPSLRLACKGGVVNVTVQNEKGGIRELLKKGFVLNWTASDCSACTRSGGRCGFDLDPDTYAFRCYCPDSVHFEECDLAAEPHSLSKEGKIGIGFAALGTGVLVFIICILLWCYKKHGLCKDKSKAQQDFVAFLENHGPLAIRRYSYLDIKKMTNSFAEKLGQGGYGSVFKGKLHDESLVAVKMLNRSNGNVEEFINEIASISRTSHVNIVTLLGFCFEGPKRALVYEYMSNGSLEKFIYGTNPLTIDKQLSCEKLYQIAIGVARGLEYLHRGCNTRIYHFDIKPHNILLDENFCPKISDFGLAKICPRDESMVSMSAARGTPGYIAPEVFSRNFGVVSHKSDVYSFGMMVMEIVGGRKNIKVEVDCTSEIYFPHWIYKRLELHEEFELRNITNESDREMMRKMVIVSLWCIQSDPSDRPTMHTVVDMLEGRVETLQIPPKPFFSSPSTSERYSSSLQ